MIKRNILTALMIAGMVMTPVTVRADEGEDTIEITEQTSEYSLNIGSVSKMYVTTAVMQLADQGKVDIDAPVTDYIPEFKLADTRYKDITVRMLMNHTSGLMGTVYGGMMMLDGINTEYSEDFLKVLSNERLKAAPGEYNCYCNDGFTLLEIIVERVSGMSFTEYLEKNISAPLGLDNTGTALDRDTIDDQIPSYINGNIRMNQECLSMFGAGGISSDAEELCTFGSAFFKGDETLLSEKAKNSMAECQATETSGIMWGLGWDQVSLADYETAGVKVLQKGGDTTFQHASLTVAPDEEISIAVISSGGSSSVNEELAQDLMDIALEEKGYTVEHPDKTVPEFVDTVPDELLGYAGRYTVAETLIDVSFPNERYMLVISLDASNRWEQQYMYTADGTFVQVSGDIESGNAIPVKPVTELELQTWNGREFIKQTNSEYIAEKLSENSISENAQKAWDERNGVTYYYISGAAGEAFYIEKCTLTLNTYDDFGGYVNACTIIDENHAENRTSIPSTASRDISDMEISELNGCELLNLKDLNALYISENDIQDFTDDITAVETTKHEASWYKLNGLENVTVKFDIPEHAAVYVYDKYGNLTYTNYMTDYKGGVPLPEYGMIVFVGDTGATIGITR